MNIYLQVSLITLICTFVIHLIARGYWVALVGMNSVYPDGIRWEKMKSSGPAYREVTRRGFGTVPEMIERADNRATLVFGLGFGMAVSLLIPAIIVGSMLVVLVICQMSNLDVQKCQEMTWLVLLILFAPFFAAYLIDYQFGNKLAEKNRNGWLKKIFSFYQKIGMRQSNNAVVTIFTSNSDTRKNAGLIIFAVVMGALSTSIILGNSGMTLDNGAYDGLPKATVGSDHTLRPQHYATLRGDYFSANLAAYIEDPVVSTPYIKLFIPYRPADNAGLMKELCPQALAQKAANEGAGMACLAKHHAPQIDGKALDVVFVAGEDAKTGQRGMIAMIDIRKLPDGPHVLVVKDVPSVNTLFGKRKERVQKIPFWK
jgi:hypothetical protein